MPREYRIIRACKTLNCTPWELEGKPSYWIDWAFITESADNLIEKELMKRSQRGYYDEDD